MFPWHVEPGHEWDGDEEHECVRGDIEACLYDGVVLQSGALRVGWWHGPVSVEWTAGSEECDFGRGPADEDVDREVYDHLLNLCAKREACVHEQHAAFYCVNNV